MGGGSSKSVRNEWEFWYGVTSNNNELQNRIDYLASHTDTSYNKDPAVQNINVELMKKTVDNALSDTTLTENPPGKCPIGDYKESFTADPGGTCSWQTVIKTLVVMVIVLFGIIAFTRFVIRSDSIQCDVSRGKNNIII